MGGRFGREGHGCTYGWFMSKFDHTILWSNYPSIKKIQWQKNKVICNVPIFATLPMNFCLLVTVKFVGLSWTLYGSFLPMHHFVKSYIIHIYMIYHILFIWKIWVYRTIQIFQNLDTLHYKISTNCICNITKNLIKISLYIGKLSSSLLDMFQKNFNACLKIQMLSLAKNLRFLHWSDRCFCSLSQKYLTNIQNMVCIAMFYQLVVL